MNKRQMKKMAKKSNATLRVDNNGVPKGYAKIVGNSSVYKNETYHHFNLGDIVQIYNLTTGEYVREDDGLRQFVNSQDVVLGDA